MSDIFISYSRKDTEEALALVKLLRSSGVDVWIDQHGIEAASSWSGEIVRAIDECTVFLLLLSEGSVASRNVARELDLASETNKKILPVILEDVRLSDSFRYHLAGLHRVAYTQFDAIAQALGGFGIATHEPRDESRKSLMVLPFEDLSPTQDNGWFADGLASEMIGKLSRIKSLKLVDRQTSLGVRKQGHTIAELAEILEVRYFIEGSVRKFGEMIKIDAALLDFQTGDYLWQDSHKGVFSDIFDIQEIIANKVVEGLKLHLATAEEQQVRRKVTENAEAYEFYLRAISDFGLQTREGYERAARMYREATLTDLRFGAAFASLANCQILLYQRYDRSASRLKMANRAIHSLRGIQPDSADYYWVLSELYLVQEELQKAEKYALLSVQLDPGGQTNSMALAKALRQQGRLSEAAEVVRGVLRGNPEDRLIHFQLILVLLQMGDKEALRDAAIEALPSFQKHRRLNPDDHDALVWYAPLLFYAGKFEEARTLTYELIDNTALDGISYYNLACLLIDLNDLTAALRTLKRAVAVGFSYVELIRTDRGLDPIRHTSDFQDILSALEAKVVSNTTADPVPE